MNFHKHQPSEALSPIIDKFWTLTSENDTVYSSRSYPDGCTTVMFNFGDPVYLTINNREIVQKPFTAAVYGNISKYFGFKIGGRVDILGMNFKPAGIFPFVKIPLFELTDCFTAVSDTSDVFDNRLLDSLAECRHHTQRIMILENFLTDTHPAQRLRELPAAYFVNRIMQMNGNLSIDQITRQTGTSQRQLERYFRRQVGISPKKLCQVLRFRHVQEFLKSPQKSSLLSLAYENGYFDHAHLTKDFKQLAGVTPSYFSQHLPYY